MTNAYYTRWQDDTGKYTRPMLIHAVLRQLVETLRTGAVFFRTRKTPYSQKQLLPLMTILGETDTFHFQETPFLLG